MASPLFTTITSARYDVATGRLLYHFTSENGKVKEWIPLNEISNPIMTTLRVCFDYHRTLVYFNKQDGEYYYMADFVCRHINLSKVLVYQRKLRHDMLPGKMWLAPSTFHTPPKRNQATNPGPQKTKVQEDDVALAFQHTLEF